MLLPQDLCCKQVFYCEAHLFAIQVLREGCQFPCAISVCRMSLLWLCWMSCIPSKTISTIPTKAKRRPMESYVQWRNSTVQRDIGKKMNWKADTLFATAVQEMASSDCQSCDEQAENIRNAPWTSTSMQEQSK